MRRVLDYCAVGFCSSNTRIAGYVSVCRTERYKQEVKSAQAMEQRVERLSLLRLSRVARESKAKPSIRALLRMFVKLIYRTSLYFFPIVPLSLTESPYEISESPVIVHPFFEYIPFAPCRRRFQHPFGQQYQSFCISHFRRYSRCCRCGIVLCRCHARSLQRL